MVPVKITTRSEMLLKGLYFGAGEVAAKALRKLRATWRIKQHFRPL